MKIILLKDLRGVGKKGDIKEISDGYARNFLIPKEIAKAADEFSLKEIKIQELAVKEKINVLHSKLAKIKKQYDATPLVFMLKVGEHKEVFGSINNEQIEERLKGQISKYKLDEIKVKLEHPLKELGERQVEIDLGKGVTGEINIKIEKE